MLSADRYAAALGVLAADSYLEELDGRGEYGDDLYYLATPMSP